MRLEKIIINKLKEAAYDSFGNVNIYLFGSRTDDTKKGGDIDIAIDADISNVQFRKNKIKFVTNLFKKDFDLKIDIVNYNTKDLFLKKQIDKNAILI
jgi:predicted nucleotidyltransferase